jgi:group I intron endonuclease
MTGKTYEIYRITHVESGKSYIGCTTQGYKNRLKEHISMANWKPVTYLHRAMSRHGIEAFRVECIAVASSAQEMARLEREFIASFGTMAPNGYNMTAGGEGTSGLLPEIRERIREAKIGVPLSSETRARISKSAKGRVFSDETRAALSAARIGMKFSDSHKAALSRAKKGKPHKKWDAPMSAEQREKLRVAISEKWNDEAYRSAVVTGCKNKVFTESTRAKIGQAAKKNWSDPEYREKTIAACRKAQLATAEVTRRVMKEKWADPEFRKHMLEARARAREARNRAAQ